MEKVLTGVMLTVFFTIVQARLPDSSLVHYSASYSGDFAGNISGGIRPGYTYMGMADMILEVHFGAGGLWKNGTLHAQFQNTHGGLLTPDYVGDLQTVSNLQNGNSSHLYELWYRHTFSKGWLKFGKIDMNVDFFASDVAGEFINSSLGIMPTIASLPVCIFPKNGTAICGHSDILENVSLTAGAFDGDPLDLGRDPYSLDFGVHPDQGFLLAGELHLNVHHYIFRAGAYVHTAEFGKIADSTVHVRGNSGFYSVNDVILNERTGVFVKFGVQNGTLNKIDKFTGAGIRYTVNDQVQAGAAFAAAFVSAPAREEELYKKRHETVVEVFLKYSVLNSFLVQPEMQYVINPGAGAAKNAVVLLMRTSAEF